MSTLLLVLAALAADPEPARLPSTSYLPAERWQMISPDLGDRKQNQPTIVDGRLLLAGNGRHLLYDIEDPYNPTLVSTFDSPFHDGEAESHQTTVHHTRTGERLVALTSGKGVDLWDLTDPTTPTLRSTVELEGIDYGDNTNAVWGLSWQGDVLYVGGTNTGVHVLDVSDPDDVVVVTRVPTSSFGEVSAGPLWAVGSLLVVTTPKESAGIATLDISDPWNPVPLDWWTSPTKSYIGRFYGSSAYLLTPFRTLDVTTDPADIQLVGSDDTPSSEYFSFGDGWLFLGSLRPEPGIFKVDVSDPDALDFVGKVEGRRDGQDRGAFTDDQFGLPVGNLLVMCDDEIRYGCVLAVHDTATDEIPPELLYSNPADGATGVAPTARIGLSFSDQLDLRTASDATVQLRELGTETLVPGSWSGEQTILTFSPESPLAPDTTYELLLPAGGLKDLAGNGLAADVRLTFATGDTLVSIPCGVTADTAIAGAPVTLTADDAGEGASYAWSLDDVDLGAGRSLSTAFAAAGRPLVSLRVTRDGRTVRCGRPVIVAAPPADVAPVASSGLLDHPDLPQVWVVSEDSGTVARYTRDPWALVDELPVGEHPRALGLDPDGTVWVALSGEDTLVALDGESGAEVGRVVLPYGSAPEGLVVDPVSGHVWVTTATRGALLEVSDGAVQREVSLGLGSDGLVPRLRALAWSPTHGLVVARYVSGPDHGELWTVDPDSGDVTATIPLPFDDGPDDHDKGRGVPNVVAQLAVSPDGGRVAYVATKDNLARGPVRDGEVLDPDNTVRTIVGVVDLDAGEEDLTARVDVDDHAPLSAVIWTPAGDALIVAAAGSNQLDVVDPSTDRLLAGASTELGPDALAIRADGTLTVRESLGRTVTTYDLADLLTGADTRVLKVASAPLLSVEPLSEVVLLGKRLFHNARSASMSQDGYISCATCHPDGGDDGQTWDFTNRGEGLRNTTDLRGRAGMGHGPVHWTGNFDEIQDFENDIRGHFGGAGLMDDTDFQTGTRADTLGDPKVGVSERLDALAAYVATLDTYPRSPWRYADGTLTDDAERGRRLFTRFACGECHSGAHLTDSALDVRHDVGTTSAASGQRRGGKLDGFDTPTLHALWASAPYLHDGSAPTLDDTLVEGHGRAGDLSDKQRAQLVAYLLQVGPDALPDEDGCGCASARTSPAAVAALALVAQRRRRRAGSR